jgi:hypothetical protein
MVNAPGLLCTGLAVSLAAPGLAIAQPANAYYERTVMVAADARCGLFAPEVGSALAAAAAQARGAALRGGVHRDELKAIQARAQATAAGADCASPDIATAAARVATGFAGYAKVWRQTYAGDVAGWTADRMESVSSRWRMAQTARVGRDQVTFGLAGRYAPGVVLATGQFADGAAPYGARLILRDPDRTPGAYLDGWKGGATKDLALDKRLPPAAAQLAFNASKRSTLGQDLAGKDGRAGWAFRFPDEAAEAMAALDPREAVAVEFLFAHDETRRAYVEVGDFAAGRAFVTIRNR